MSTTTHSLKKAVGAAEDAESDTNDVESLLEQAEKRRTTVSRVLECVRGNLTPDKVKATDWFSAIEHVHADTGEDLVLYEQNDHPDAPQSATIHAVDDEHGRIIQWGWSEFRVMRCDDDGFCEPHYVDRRDVEEGLRFLQSGDSGPDVMRLDDAVERVQAFAAERGGET